MKIATPSKRVGASNALASLMFQAQKQSNNPKGAPNQRAGFCVSQEPTTPSFTIGIMWSIAQSDHPDSAPVKVVVLAALPNRKISNYVEHTSELRHHQ